jgi:hypothetical protein
MRALFLLPLAFGIAGGVASADERIDALKADRREAAEHVAFLSTQNAAKISYEMGYEAAVPFGDVGVPLQLALFTSADGGKAEERFGGMRTRFPVTRVGLGGAYLTMAPGDLSTQEIAYERITGNKRTKVPTLELTLGVRSGFVVGVKGSVGLSWGQKMRGWGMGLAAGAGANANVGIVMKDRNKSTVDKVPALGWAERAVWLADVAIAAHEAGDVKTADKATKLLKTSLSWVRADRKGWPGRNRGITKVGK